MLNPEINHEFDDMLSACLAPGQQAYFRSKDDRGFKQRARQGRPDVGR